MLFHLVCLPARRKESFPCHDFDSPFINENGSRVIAEDTAFFALLTSDFLGQMGMYACLKRKCKALHGLAQESQNSLPTRYGLCNTGSRVLAGFLRWYEPPSVAAG